MENSIKATMNFLILAFPCKIQETFVLKVDVLKKNNIYSHY